MYLKLFKITYILCSINMSLSDYTESFNLINNSLTLFKMQISTLQQQVKTIEKNVKKELKQNEKKTKLVLPKAKKAPSGFAKPTKVTKELCEFMERPEGTEIARTEVTKALVNYIKSNNLQEQTTDLKNKIIPDDKLKNLLGLNVEETQDLTFFNIQKHMNKHFFSKKNQATL
jgi:chromatin remodeling complex protein RSC6